MNLLKDITLYYSIYMERFMDQCLKLCDKDDHPTHGIYKISLDEVADALGYWKAFDSNLRPYYRILQELTNEYLVEHREFITIKTEDDILQLKTRFTTKHAFLLLAMICDKHKNHNWLDHEQVMKDHKTYISLVTCIPAGKIFEDRSDDSE